MGRGYLTFVDTYLQAGARKRRSISLGRAFTGSANGSAALAVI